MSEQVASKGAEHDLPNDSALSHLVGYAAVQTGLAPGKVFQEFIGWPMNLPPVEFTLLTMLSENPLVSRKDLAAQLQVPAPNLTVILN